jgi:adenylyl-sulfate kinase
MIIDKMSSEDLPSRITPHEKEQITRGENLISTADYVKQYNQKSATLWITGLHGSGKNLLAFTLEKRLFDMGATVVLLDGFSFRSGLSRELEFTTTDRAEHLRRVAHMCKILNDQGIITICSFISPDENIRQQVADIVGRERFHLFYMDADIGYCREIDRYGLYKQVKEGKLKQMPGIDAAFDKPQDPQLVFVPDDPVNIEKAIGYIASEGIFPLE